jgi:hypothetical protein
MQEDEKVARWLTQGRANAGGPESINLLHAAILALSRPFCKLPAGICTVA